MKHWLALFLAWASPVAADPVAVTGGLIEGRGSDDRRARIYEGIPFAAPPLGDLRWRAPQPVVPWAGVRKTTQPAPACLQNDYEWNRQNYLFGAEDCLTLDVRTQAKAGEKLPVMVWIHGGSNRAGSGAGTVHSRITEQGVVLVAIQYRLGIFGFLSHRSLAKEQGGASGNYGLMDQIAALQWVQANIAQFGGDPGNVTIFGESAGAQDVSLLLAAPAAQRLFHKAIMQSGTPGVGVSFRLLSDAFKLGDQLDGIAGAKGDLAALRRTSAHALLAADLKLRDPALWSQDFMWLRITTDGQLFDKTPAQLLDTATPKPVIIGNNRFEFGPSADSIDVEAYARHWLGDKAGAALTLYRKEEAEGPDPRLGHLEGRMETDFVFRCPANNLARKLAARGWPVWRYEFDVGPDNGTSAGGLTSHAYDVAFIMDRKPLGAPIFLQDIWTDFAKTSANRMPELRGWSRFSNRENSYAHFDRKGMTMQSNLRQAHCMSVKAI